MTTQTNPRSLANLKPPWPKGVSGNQGNVRGPVITPRMRHYAQMSYLDLLALAQDQAQLDLLPMMDVIAITMLVKAAKEVAWGDTARKDVIERLDGKAADVEVSVQVAVGIALKWDDDTPA